MPDFTPRLGLPWLMPAQARKHVTVNEALGRLDAITGAAVASRTLAAQPSAPDEGDAYILPAGASGSEWEAFVEHDLAYFQDGAWARVAARAGLTAYVADESALVMFDGGAWTAFSDAIATLGNLQGLGVGTAPDAANPFAAKLNQALWTARPVAEGGTGDLRYTLNKEGEPETLSLVFQSGWSGRAEIGLTGSDDLSVKTSPDGASWTTALKVDRQTGAVDLAGPHSIAGAQTSSLVFTPGGDNVVTIWRVDAPRGPLPRTSTISAVAGDVVTLTGSDAPLFTNHSKQSGASYLRIWNSSVAPEQSAWLKAVPDWGAGDSQLQVTAAADIAGWSPGDVVRIGELAPNGDWVCAIDISAMMQQVFAAEFRQSGVMVRAALISDSAGDLLRMTADGASESYVNAAITTAPGALAGASVTIVQCTQASPISNTNLVFVAEKFAGQAGLALISVYGVFR
ncbi:MAG: DUF2793 domain-containing protein [Oceanicaulis sp.]